MAEPLQEILLRLRHEEQFSVIDIAERPRVAGRTNSFHTVWLLRREVGVGRLSKRATRNRPVLLPLPVSVVGEVRVVTGREVEGDAARKLKKYLLRRGDESWTWIGTGGLAQSKAAEQGLWFHIAGKRKVSRRDSQLCGCTPDGRPGGRPCDGADAVDPVR